MTKIKLIKGYYDIAIGMLGVKPITPKHKSTIDIATASIVDNHGKSVMKEDNKFDLRDHSVDDLLAMIEKGIRNEQHRGDEIVMLPVGWALISTEEYDKRLEPSWWFGTIYEKPIVAIKLSIVFAVMLAIPYVALTRIENMPDEWRITAKNNQESASG